MKLMIVTSLVLIIWITLGAAALRNASKADSVVPSRLFTSMVLAGISIALWFLWYQIRFTIHPLDFLGHWKMVGVSFVGIVTATASAIVMPGCPPSIRGAWIICSLLMIGVFLLTAVVSVPVS
jgi:hypothetical protein